MRIEKIGMKFYNYKMRRSILVFHIFVFLLLVSFPLNAMACMSCCPDNTNKPQISGQVAPCGHEMPGEELPQSPQDDPYKHCVKCSSLLFSLPPAENDTPVVFIAAPGPEMSLWADIVYFVDKPPKPL